MKLIFTECLTVEEENKENHNLEEKKEEDSQQLNDEKEQIVKIEEDNKQKEEDISLDFSEIKEKTKKIFQGLKTSVKSNKKKKDDDDGLPLDFTKITSFAKKNSKWLIPVVLILITMLFSIYFRTMPLDLPITDEWAENNVHNFYHNQIEGQINSQYPNLPPQNRAALVEKEFNKKLKDNQDQIQNDVKILSSQYKEQFRDDDGTLYLLGIDPWHFYRQSYYVLKNGYPGTRIEGEQIRDDYRLAPISNSAHWDFHTWFGAKLHGFLSFFSDVPLIFSFFLI